MTGIFKNRKQAEKTMIMFDDPDVTKVTTCKGTNEAGVHGILITSDGPDPMRIFVPDVLKVQKVKKVKKKNSTK